jgi:hypothetical protein
LYIMALIFILLLIGGIFAIWFFTSA